MAGTGDKIRLLFENSFCGRVMLEQIVDRGDTLELLVIHDLEGIYLKKVGTHKMGAMVFWKSIPNEKLLSLEPRLGGCVYFPDIKLKLPFFLPDFGLSDLCDVAYPAPILTKSWFISPKQGCPPWLEVADGARFNNWNSNGPRPIIIEEYFPDL